MATAVALPVGEVAPERPSRAGPAVRLEGPILAPDILERLATGDLPGQRPTDFGLSSGRSIIDEAAEAYRDARDLYKLFRRGLERLPETDPGTTLTRERWVLPLFSLLGYELRFNPRGYDVGDRHFAISHRAGANDDAPPVHVVGAGRRLGSPDPNARPRVSPHSLMQEFLNRSDHLWGIVTNGRELRLLRKSSTVHRQAYVAFDLDAIFGGEERFGDFLLLWRLLHRTRLPRSVADAHECWLERYHQQAIEQGNRARDRLRDGVERCLALLGTGFLRCWQTEKQPSAERLYHDLLRLVYRFLFLLVAEERGLLVGNELYREHYSVSRLRRLVDRRQSWTHHDDLWCSLRVLFNVMRHPQPKVEGEPMASLLGLPVLDGELFREIELERQSITNRDLLEAFRHLVYFYDDEARTLRRVNYAALDVEELGSVYESLLEHRPVIRGDGGSPIFEFASGTERKSTGSYYTPRELVAELVESALEPVLRERLAGLRNNEERKSAILGLNVLDPACGSGHFLLAAARRLAKELARVSTGEDEPSPEAEREAKREVIAHCIYGVDKNPLAVELCKVALWIESQVPGRPLSFLDHHIRCGDSLVGITSLAVFEGPIPEGAFERSDPAEKKVARGVRERSTREAQQRPMSFEPPEEEKLLPAAIKSEELERRPDDTVADIIVKERDYNALRREMEPFILAANVWTAAFFWNFAEDDRTRVTEQPTTGSMRRALAGDGLAPVFRAGVEKLAVHHRFFHWPLEFPDVFIGAGGFDVVLGNPPWERIKLQEQEFFAGRDPEIANAPNAAARKRLIQQLAETNPALWKAYQKALHAAESTSRFLRGSGQYPLTGRGDINTYSVFAERMRSLLKPGGRAGIIVPTGIATDDTNKHFFADLVDRGELVSLFDFENREGLFPAVDSRYKFCLLTMRRGAGASARTGVQMAFFCTRAEHLRDPRRAFTLSPQDIARLNPNTRTLPVFRTRQDAELTKAIYARVPVLVSERTGQNPWGVKFLAMFHMSNDSHLFRTRAELEGRGFRLVGNVFVKGDPHSPFAVRYLPLYEAKMIWHYDHRYGTYEGVEGRSSTQLPTSDDAQHADPAFLVQPWYWVPAEEVEARLGDWHRGWLLGFRRIARSTDERTAIFSLLPRAGAGDVLPVVFGPQAVGSALLLTCNSTIVFDFVVRQKIGGVHLDFHYAKQLPVLPPSAYTPQDLLFIVPRVLELIYTAWDIKPFADDVWREASEPVREAICRRWEENAAETGGHGFELPAWAAAYPHLTPADPHALHSPFAIPHSPTCPLPPFKWHELRRARLRAELDAYYARLYGLTRKQLRYILDPADLTERELADILDPWEEVDDPLEPTGYTLRCEQSTFPGETFRVLKEKELRQYGEYRTRRLVLEAWERLEEAS
jgi:hypothetical protein